MKAKNYPYYWSYRSPRTTQERRLACSEEHKPYVRAKRGKRGLPNSYDDVGVGKKEKNWKVRRKHQYRIGKRGQKHEIFLPSSVYEWYITQYLEQQDIPYEIHDIREGYIKWCVYRHNYNHYSKLIGHKLTYWTDKDIRFPDSAFQDKFSWRVLY